MTFVWIGSLVPLLHDDWRSELQSPPVQTVMSNFSIYKKNEEDWYSPSFVSSPNGYEMCVHILANGQDEGQGTHLSVYVHLMAGKNDDLLSWSFQGEVKVQLINRRGDYDHYEQNIMFDDSSNVQACSRVINGIPIKAGLANRIGEGKTLFIPQDKLQTSTSDFLREDSIRVCIKEVIVHSSNAVSPVAPVSSQSDPLPPTILDFVIENFSKRKRSNEECISEPFYSHKSGYKMSLLVYPNGRGKCKDKYISIFVHLMKGENDNNLTFPFCGEILTQIINWKNVSKNHAEQNIEFNEKIDPKGVYGARFTGLATLLAEGQYHGYGFPNFLSHKFLEFDESCNSQYVSDDDSLHIRIVKITLRS